MVAIHVNAHLQMEVGIDVYQYTYPQKAGCFNPHPEEKPGETAPNQMPEWRSCFNPHPEYHRVKQAGMILVTQCPCSFQSFQSTPGDKTG